MNRLESLAAHEPLFAETRGDIQVSFEFFPPKTEKMEETLWESVKTLEPLGPALRLGDLWRRRLDPRADPRDGRADRPRNRDPRRRASDLRQRHPRRGRRDRARLLGGRRAPYRRDPRRSARAGREIRPASRRLRQCRRAGRRPQAGRAVRDFGRRLSRMPSRIRRASTPISTISSARSTPAPNRATTQFFFDPECFFRYQDKVAAAGIDIEILPGIMPVTNFAAINRMAAMNGTAVPDWVGRLVRGARRPSRRAPAGRRDDRGRAVRRSFTRAASATSISTRSTAPS